MDLCQQHLYTIHAVIVLGLSIALVNCHCSQFWPCTLLSSLAHTPMWLAKDEYCFPLTNMHHQHACTFCIVYIVWFL